MNWPIISSGKRILTGRFLILGSVFCLGGCYFDNEEELYPELNCNTSEITFSQTITPILINNCFSCHSNVNSPGSGSDINLEDYNNLKLYVDNGILLSAIKHDGNASPMPADGGKLSDCQIRQIEIWINSGAPNN